MAGLSCAYHLLRKTSQEGNPVQVTILDEDEVGRKGASSVAGGYVRLLTCFAMEHYAYQ
jgi:glycine/D-amino acid oxidase-like deaminating enzyme